MCCIHHPLKYNMHKGYQVDSPCILLNTLKMCQKAICQIKE